MAIKFSKKDISSDKAFYQRVIDVIEDIALSTEEAPFNDPAQVIRYRSLLCSEPEPTLAICRKVFATSAEKSRATCEAAGCPIYPQCYEYVDILWRCGRALLYLAGQGGYPCREGMEARCKVCGNYEVCRGSEGEDRAKSCIAYLKASADKARDEIVIKLV